MSGQRTRWIVPLIVLVLFAAWRVAARHWLCDDSFISLRYVENLLAGHGLVYNPGEQVEGYTHFLWIAGLSGLVALGAQPEVAAQVLGALSYASLAALLVGWWLSHRQDAPEFPVAAGLVLGLDDFHVWATGGLETMAFAAFALAGLLLTCRSRPTPRSDLAASALLGLAVLTRPDGILFLLAGLTRPWWPAPEGAAAGRIRRTALLLAPAAVLVAAQVVFKLAYYGELLPTPFYSKSALRPWYTQGALYLGLWLAKNWAILPVAAVAVARASWRPRSAAQSDALFLTLTGLLYVLYVVHSGGDFMFARRLIPALPLLFLGLEHAIGRLGGGALPRTLLAVLLLGSLVPVPLYGPQRWRISGIADEPRFYTSEVVEMRRGQGELVGGLLAATPARVMLQGGMCSFGYYSKLPYLIEMTGLTQYSLARLPLSSRGYVGHEKGATAQWLADNRVDLIMWQADPPFRPGSTGTEHDQIYFGTLAKAQIVRYSDAVMDPLRGRPDVTFVPIERLLDRARESIRAGSPADARSVFEYLDRYYFRSGGPKAEKAAEEFRNLLRTQEAKPR